MTIVGVSTYIPPRCTQYKKEKGRVAFTMKNVICDTPFVIFMNIVLPFFL